MNILNRFDLKKIKKSSTSVRFLFLFWLFFALLTLLAFYFQIRALSDVDVPTHLGAGLVIAAFIFSTVKVKSGREALLLAFVPFVLWELIEMLIAGTTHDPFLYRLFQETRGNHLQDVVMDTLGFLVFMKLSGRRF
jgi:uncharacterized membrane protein